MVDCCANLECRAEFKRLHSGNLYARERRASDTEFFWLCSECAPRFDLMLDPDGRLSFRPRSEPRHMHPLNREDNLRLITSSAHRLPWHKTTPSNEPPTTENISDWEGLAS
jgi:hypothetical protein